MVFVLLLLEALLLSKALAVSGEVLRMLFLVLRCTPPIVLAVFVEEVVCVMRLVAKDGSLCVCLVLCLH